MDETDARQWLIDHCDVSRETFGRLQDFVNLLSEENARQNLVSQATLEQVWTRHIVDSAQLFSLVAPSKGAPWLDLGTGAGFPGLIVAMLHCGKVTMVEERKKRVDFLRRAAAVLGIEESSEIIPLKVERMDARPFAVISARAFAPLDKLLALGERFATPGTRWVLPKGRNAQSELAAVESSWQGVFRIEPSITDAEAGIIVAEQVRPRVKGKRG